MPYIPQHERHMFDPELQLLEPMTAGQLNYVLTKIVHSYVERNGGRYQQFNDAIGALEGAKLELYRRKVAPYEDTKIAENGDV